MTASQCEAAIAKECEETSAEVTEVRPERDTAAARHHELLVLICCIVEARKIRTDEVPDTFAKLRKVYDERHKDRVEAHVVGWCVFRKQVAFLMSDLESKTLEVQGILGLASEAVGLQQKLAEAWKKAGQQNIKLALMGQIVMEISTIKQDVSKLLWSFTKAWE